MLKSLLMKLKLYRKYIKKREIQKQTDTLEDLLLIRDSFNKAVDYESVLNSFKRILNNGIVELDTSFIINKATKVSFYTKTSNDALDLIDKNVYGRESLSFLERQFSFSAIERPYMYWESNEDSILLLYSFMKDMINKSTIYYGTIDNKYLEQNKISKEEADFLESILFRYLCFDLVTLLIFYMEERNATIK